MHYKPACPLLLLPPPNPTTTVSHTQSSTSLAILGLSVQHLIWILLWFTAPLEHAACVGKNKALVVFYLHITNNTGIISGLIFSVTSPAAGTETLVCHTEQGLLITLRTGITQSCLCCLELQKQFIPHSAQNSFSSQFTPSHKM